MKILKPQFAAELLDAGALLEPLLDAALAEETPIRGVLLENERMQGENLAKVCFSHSILRGCRFAACRAERGEYLDVRFERCDFSGMIWNDAYFSRCEFIDCKGVGAQLQGAVLKNVVLARCNFSYSDLDGALIERVLLRESDFSHSYLSQCRIKGLKAEKTDFTRASFFHTPLKGVDFTGNRIEGLTVALEDLPGVIVDVYQAADLAKMLGLVVKMD